MPARRLLMLAAAAAACGLGACGGDTTNQSVADNEGIYVDVGKLKYQVQLSRQLNPYSAEDAAYVAGLPPAQRSLSPQQAWFAVFMLVLNKTSQAHAAASSYFITDTQGTVYRPTPLPSLNPFGYRAETLGPHSQLPALDSPAYDGPTAGAALLFKVPIAAYDNRPLVLHIVDPTNTAAQATVELDV